MWQTSKTCSIGYTDAKYHNAVLASPVGYRNHSHSANLSSMEAHVLNHDTLSYLGPFRPTCSTQGP